MTWPPSFIVALGKAFNRRSLALCGVSPETGSRISSRKIVFLAQNKAEWVAIWNGPAVFSGTCRRLSMIAADYRSSWAIYARNRLNWRTSKDHRGPLVRLSCEQRSRKDTLSASVAMKVILPSCGHIACTKSKQAPSLSMLLPEPPLLFPGP